MMETGFDIIFFWVARMMMTGIHFMGKTPFATVYLHAMVRDAEGRKESKSIGNVRDPLDVIYGISGPDLIAKRQRDAESLGISPEKVAGIVKATKKEYPDGMSASGADALRFTLISMVGAGRDIKLDTKRVEGYRFFANKIWNASRFALMNLEGYDPAETDAPLAAPSLADRWILARLRQTAIEVNEAMTAHHYDQAAMAVYHFFWDEYCDWYIEFAKSALYKSEEPGRKRRAQATLARVLDDALRLLHPFMPFITEEIWQKLPKAPDATPFIMLAPYPDAARYVDVAEFAQDVPSMNAVMAVINQARNIRGECGIEPGKRIPLVIVAASDELRTLIARETPAISDLARLESLEVLAGYTKSGPCAKGVFAGGECYIPLLGLIDLDEEKKRARSQMEKAKKEIGGIEGRLNSDFVNRAPAEVVEQNRARLTELTEKIEKLTDHLRELEG